MSSQVQYRRGTNAQNIAFTGALAEITVDTTNGTLRVHDAITAGGSNIATVAYVTSQISALSANSITSGTSNFSIIASGGNIRGNVGGATVTNIYSGGIELTGLLSATGNVTGAYIIGNGSQLTGLPAGYANSDVATYLASGNVITDIKTTAAISATGNISGGNLNVTGNIVDTGALTIITGSNGNIALAPNGTGIVTASGAFSAVGTVTGGNIATGGTVSATGNITGGNVLGGANVNATTHTGTTVSVTGTITGGSLTVTTGNITAGNLLISGAIQDSGQLDIQTTAGNANIVLTPNGTGNVNISANIMPTANATANIGSATSSFNTVFAKATSAQYADLAENYLADAAYSPGTVVEFGGNNEVTVSTMDHSTAVAGIVSTDPAYLMNSHLQSVYTVAVALIGRVPCRVQGPVKKGSVLVTGTVPGTAMAIDNLKFKPGCVVGKAMETIDSVDVKTIEVAVGRL